MFQKLYSQTGKLIFKNYCEKKVHRNKIIVRLTITISRMLFEKCQMGIFLFHKTSGFMIKCKLINGTAWHPLYICSHHCCMDRAVHPCPYMTASHAFVKKNRLSPNLFKTTNQSNPLLHILPLARCRVFKSEPAFYYGRVLAIYKR